MGLVEIAHAIGSQFQHRQRQVQLGLLDNSTKRTWRPKTAPAARKSDWRIVGVERYGIRENEHRGGSGLLHVTQKRTPVTEELNQVFVRAGREAGYPLTEDQNGFRQEGFGPMDMTVTPRGERASTATCYLDKKMDNLEVVPNAFLSQLILDGNKARGVKVTINGQEKEIYAEKEVILCAGAVGSTQTLLLSGIGPSEHLQALGIPIVQDLPVGENLQDHLEFYVQYLCSKPVSLYPYAATFSGFGRLSQYLFRKPWNAVRVGAEWMLRGSGMAASNQFEVGGFIRSDVGVPHPDIQFHYIPACVVGQLEFLSHHGYQAHCGTMRPTSRGTIRLQSRDPREAPLIDPNFLATQKDIEDQRKALRLCMEIMNQPAFDEYRKEILEPKIDLSSDAECDEWIRSHTHSGYHLSCTNAIGRVVDPEGKVYGMESLRVIDASVMPSMVSGNLNATTIMLAEKMSDSILGERLPSKNAPVAPTDTTKQRVKTRTRQ
eukprot:GEMP01027852.1.p1 GENE.GEMP01027852.1~~GEMP01027852.1.p1  ORF type:complete len:490 (+),score=87.10 GEMP01027852.1:244-1713(+)